MDCHIAYFEPTNNVFEVRYGNSFIEATVHPGHYDCYLAMYGTNFNLGGILFHQRVNHYIIHELFQKVHCKHTNIKMCTKIILT